MAHVPPQRRCKASPCSNLFPWDHSAVSQTSRKESGKTLVSFCPIPQRYAAAQTERSTCAIDECEGPGGGTEKKEEEGGREERRS